MENDNAGGLSAAELKDLRCVAGMMVPASTEYAVPGADDAAIFADIVKSLGRDLRDVRRGAEHAVLAGRRRVCRAGRVAARDRCRGVPRARRRGGRGALARGPAMLLPRRPRGALARTGAAPALPEGTHAGAGRLVAARPGARAPEDVARRALV